MQVLRIFKNGCRKLYNGVDLMFGQKLGKKQYNKLILFLLISNIFYYRGASMYISEVHRALLLRENITLMDLVFMNQN